MTAWQHYPDALEARWPEPPSRARRVAFTARLAEYPWVVAVEWLRYAVYVYLDHARIAPPDAERLCEQVRQEVWHDPTLA